MREGGIGMEGGTGERVCEREGERDNERDTNDAISDGGSSMLNSSERPKLVFSYSAEHQLNTQQQQPSSQNHRKLIAKSLHNHCNTRPTCSMTNRVTL
eukprot:9497649-Pyramimonas_sp.AAC.1